MRNYRAEFWTNCPPAVVLSAHLIVVLDTIGIASGLVCVGAGNDAAGSTAVRETSTGKGFRLAPNLAQLTVLVGGD